MQFLDSSSERPAPFKRRLSLSVLGTTWQKQIGYSFPKRNKTLAKSRYRLGSCKFEKDTRILEKIAELVTGGKNIYKANESIHELQKPQFPQQA